MYKLFFSPVSPEQGTIPSGQLNYSNFEYLNIPSKKLNVNNIIEQKFFPKKNKNKKTKKTQKYTQNSVTLGL